MVGHVLLPLPVGEVKFTFTSSSRGVRLGSMSQWLILNTADFSPSVIRSFGFMVNIVENKKPIFNFFSLCG